MKAKGHRLPWAIILCGGRGHRMGSATQDIPKPLIRIHDRPILWYSILTLYKHGFRNIVLPLGYRGERIREFVEDAFHGLNCTFMLIDTGVDTSIAKRIHVVAHVIPDKYDFLLLNGDTLFDFNLAEMYNLHKSENALLTLSSVNVKASFGLIIEQDGHINDFARDQRISHCAPANLNNDVRGYMHSGFAWLNKDALTLIDLLKSTNFEHDLYSVIARMGKAAHYKINGHWFAVDTVKDIQIANSARNRLNQDALSALRDRDTCCVENGVERCFQRELL